VRLPLAPADLTGRSIEPNGCRPRQHRIRRQGTVQSRERVAADDRRHLVRDDRTLDPRPLSPQLGCDGGPGRVGFRVLSFETVEARREARFDHRSDAHARVSEDDGEMRHVPAQPEPVQFGVDDELGHDDGEVGLGDRLAAVGHDAAAAKDLGDEIGGGPVTVQRDPPRPLGGCPGFRQQHGGELREQAFCLRLVPARVGTDHADPGAADSAPEHGDHPVGRLAHVVQHDCR